MRALSLTVVAVLSAFAGCLAESPETLDVAPGDTADADVWTGTIFTRGGCSGYNAITFVDGAGLRPYVPSNWTFTSPSGREEVSILRIHVVGCQAGHQADDEWGFHLILSTPMHPDEASEHHHDNPDVVIGIYSNDATAIANWTAAGFPAQNATFDWSEAGTGDTVHVATTDGDVLHLVTLDPHNDPLDTYAWPAPYAAGREDISWFWGHENASARRVALVETTLGSASPVAGMHTTQWFVQAWVRFDVAYQAGTPPE